MQPNREEELGLSYQDDEEGDERATTTGDTVLWNRSPPSRIRTFEIAQQHADNLSPWNSLPLMLSWISHLFCLIVLLIEGGNYMVSHQNIHIFYGSLLVATLVMELTEIALYNGGLLKPGTYLAFQIAKAIGWTTHNWRSIGSLLGKHVWINPSSLNRIYLIAMGAMPVICIASLSYSMLVFQSERNRRRRENRCTKRQDSAHGSFDQEISIIEVNQASSLNHDSPKIFRLLNWLDFPDENQSRRLHITSQVVSCAKFTAKYLAASLLGPPIMAFTSRLPGEAKQHGVSEPRRFASWDYPEVLIPTRRQLYYDDPDTNEHEPEQLSSQLSARYMRHSQSTTSLRRLTPPDTRGSATDFRSNIARQLGPRYLCFLVHSDESEEDSYVTRRVANYTASVGYVFVSYTRRQFYTQIWNDPSGSVPETEQQKSIIARDKATLTQFAMRAARHAGVPAFWIDFECVRPDEGESANECMEDVYRICDIVRASHSLAVVISSPHQHSDHSNNLKIKTENDKSAWLHDWGRRLWTVPEALLSPSEHRIAVYAVGSEEPEFIAKRNFANRAYYDDADSMQQLMDHYESSLHLTPLQFISLALECLQRRQTEKRMAGDVAYALMGLMRQRPKVNREDTDFQAFARLSLANDSNMLLERMLCLNPERNYTVWHDLNDAWQAKLWDIEPLCQIAGADSHTVTLGGVFGTTINWSRLEPIDFEGSTTRRKLMWMYTRGTAGLAFALALLPLALFPMWYIPSHVKTPDSGLQKLPGLATAIAIFLEVTCVIFALTVPSLLDHLRTGDNFACYSCQARFFGVEGIPDLDQVEQLLFGARHKWLKWANQQDVVHQPPIDGQSDLRTFTLIDTNTLSATTFYAHDPPAVVLVCGRERGMLRSLLCSFDWDSSTFIREVTMRMEAVVLQKMRRMDRLKLAVVR